MIYVLSSGAKYNASMIVYSAISRSFSKTMVEGISFSALNDKLRLASYQQVFFVVIDPLESWVNLLIEAYETTHIKLLILGVIPPKLATYLGVEVSDITEDIQVHAACNPARAFEFAESALLVRYVSSIGNCSSPILNRPFLRYDFADEWNNLGYGAIRVDRSIWSLSCIVNVDEGDCIASISNCKDDFGAYSALWNRDNASILWFNRSVGPVDSAEWKLVESYFGDYRASELPCVPYLSEIPYGYQAAVTMRLDCDENIESARTLWDTYQQMGVPFSLAIHTKVLNDQGQYRLPSEVLANGGAILSHTATHAPEWGGDYDKALNEANLSKSLIKDKIGFEVRYAVSPFHQTPIYARLALSDAGYMGCVGGIVRNDPDFLMARSGVPPFSESGFVGHSQQCMLHGDCMLKTGNPLAIFKRAFDYAYQSSTFFGYLDHPFSARYQYGWESEDQRITAHKNFVEYIKKHPDVLFANENDAMDFLRNRSRVNIEQNENVYKISHDGSFDAKWSVTVCYQGLSYELTEQGVII